MPIDSMPIIRMLTIGAILLKDFFIINPLHFLSQLWGQVLQYHFSSSRSVFLITLLTVKYKGRFFVTFQEYIFTYLIAISD